MIEYLTGTLTESNPHKMTIEVGGIGYGLFIPLSTFESLPKIGTKIKVYVSEVIREDSHKAYGFLSLDERNSFELLNNVSGVGPKLSISILGHMNLSDLQIAVGQANAKAISQVPGIGKKMAERLILELRDKFQKISLQKGETPIPQIGTLAQDATSALINLGYNPLSAQKAVTSILSSEEKEPPLPQLISLALKVAK